MTIDRWITKAAQEHPEKTAIEFEGEMLTYGAFSMAIDAMCQELRAKDISYGDRVAWYGLNHPKVFILLFACARLGAILVPLNWRLAPGEIAEIVAQSGPSVVFSDEKFSTAAATLVLETPGNATKAEVQETDPLLIVYTSGATGKPKGVVLTQQALVANAEMSIDAHGLEADDRVLNVLPLFHVGGLNILPTPAFSIGATVILHRSFDPVMMLDDLSRVSAAITVPTVLSSLIALPQWKTADLSSLRCLSIGSTDVPLDLISRVHSRGIPLVQIYGATETAPFAIYQTWRDAMQTEGSIGRCGTCDVKLVNADGAGVEENAAGEIWVRGDNVLTNYWRNPEQTAQSMQSGWFKTGDVARVAADGQYYFVDRIKHIIISGGENIYPAEIERLLRDAPSVAELCVVGMADAKWGEVPIVVAVATKPIDPKSLLSRLEGKLARYKRPKQVIFVDALPRNAMGKVVAAEVRQMISARQNFT